MDTDPPLDDWERAGALAEILRIARGIEHEDFTRDVAPRLRRLSGTQRARVGVAIREALEQEWPARDRDAGAG